MHRRTRRSAAFLWLPLVLCLTAGSTTAASAVAREHAGRTAYVIISPSGNAECDAMIDPGELMDMRCSIKKFTPHLPRPASAQCDWLGGSLYSIAPTGKGRLDSFCDAIIDIPRT